MFESHYLKPFMVSLGITIILISGMGLSLRGMAGTGPTHDAAEISFNLLMMVKAIQGLRLLILHRNQWKILWKNHRM